MKKISITCLLSIMTFALAGCGSEQAQTESTQQQEIQAEETQAEETPQAETEAPEETQAPEETETVQEESADTTDEEGKTLIAYFTWADNTQVDNPDAVDVDASTSASVLPPGNVGLIAGWIQEEIGGDLFSIQVEDLYSSDYDECLDRASQESADDARPALATHVENMDEYDTIYLGYPNWWYSCPMPILSFIDEYNWEGKQIVLFCSHGTGGLAGSVEAITNELPDNCSISGNVLGVYRPEVADSQGDVLNWVQEIQTEIQ